MNKRTMVDPFDRNWVQSELAGLAARADAGEPEDGLRDELFQSLWPWTMQMADREARRLPARSDADETRSQLICAVWQATSRIDWSRYLGWPSLLRRRLIGARMDAARSDDPMSRRHRQAFSRAAEAIAEQEQQVGRRLDSVEREEVASRHFSRFVKPGIFAELTEVACHHETTENTPPEVADERWDPERAVLDGEVRETVQAWVDSLPRPVAAPLLVWWRGSSGHMPRSLAAKLAPFQGQLDELVQR